MPNPELRRPPLRYRKKFREYQFEAIQVARKYRLKFRENPSVGSALICHPTGTGKTAVIAGLALASPEIKTTLVLATREAIRDQLVQELSGNLFINTEKFSLSSRIRFPKTVLAIREAREISMLASDVHNRTRGLLSEKIGTFAARQYASLNVPESSSVLDLTRGGKVVLVMTVQMLGRLQKKPTDYQKLQRAVDLVLFDEGHYEPAATYSKSVRGLNVPSVLLSATPFRNDLKAFKIDSESVHILKYADAVKGDFVRDVKTVRRKSTNDPNRFCEDLISFCTEEFGENKSRWPRIIIHCDDRSRITQLGDAFTNMDQDVVGIHDRFPEASKEAQRSWHHRNVPNPRDEDAKIWIHQYKLMEGIDDHRFAVVAFFDHLRNVRSVVQQVGRTIRRSPDGTNEQQAYVLDHFKGRISQYWELYKSYDQSLDKELLLKSTARFYLDAFRQAHPQVDYIDRKFRRFFDVHSFNDPEDEILFKRRVSFKKLKGDDDYERIVKSTERQLEQADMEFRLYKLKLTQASTKPDALLYLYAGIETPDFLLSQFYAEVRNGARLFLFLWEDGIVATTDTSGGRANFLPDYEAIDREKLKRLISPGQRGRVSAVSSQNTNLGNRVVRRRSLTAPSMSDVPPNLDDHGHVLSTLIGYNGDRGRIVDDLLTVEVDVRGDLIDRASSLGGDDLQAESVQVDSGQQILRRYIGMASGHVTEDGEPLRAHAFRSWVSDLVTQMKDGEVPLGIFERYAGYAGQRVTDGRAENILLDLYDLQDQFDPKDKPNEGIRWKDLCLSTESNGNQLEYLGSGRHQNEVVSSFEIELNDEPHKLFVAFNPNTQRYRIEAPSIDAAFSARKDFDRRPLSQVLNSQQLFSVIPRDKRFIYVQGRFFAPRLKFGEHFDEDNFFVGKCLYPAERFKKAQSEKGRHVLGPRGGKVTERPGRYYDVDSLFGLIDSWGNGFDTRELALHQPWTKKYQPEDVAFEPSIVICDDMGTEAADFILADEATRRVVLVHAKASSTWRPFSASAVQEVCAQAQKNTALFSMFSLREPPNKTLWSGSHEFSGGKDKRLKIGSRIRKPYNENSDLVWERLRSLLLNPHTDREVWITLGNMLSASRFAKGMREPDPKAEVLQLNHLLQTTIAALAQLGAKTRIFCAP